MAAAVGLLKFLNPFSTSRLYGYQRSISVCTQRAFTTSEGDVIKLPPKLKAKEKLETLNLPPKPRRPMSSFMLYILDMKEDIVKDNPHFKWRQILKEGGAIWRNTPESVKDKYSLRSKDDFMVYAQEMLEYRAKLSKEQMEGLKDYRDEIRRLKVKRNLIKRIKELRKPKRPVSSFVRFCLNECKTKNLTLLKSVKDLSAQWKTLSDSEKSKYDNEYLNAKENYEKALLEWERKMMSEGNEDVVRKHKKRDSDETTDISKKVVPK